MGLHNCRTVRPILRYDFDLYFDRQIIFQNIYTVEGQVLDKEAFNPSFRTPYVREHTFMTSAREGVRKLTV